MELIMGSNTFRNTSAILNVEGKDQIALEIGKIDKQLLLTMEIYDYQGNLIGKIVRNAWAFNDKNRFTITTHPSSLKLIDKQTGNTIVEAKVIGVDKIEVPYGIFFTHKGHLLQINPNELILPGNNKLIGCTIDGCGRAIVLA
jgi:hypothetical protein